MEHEERLREYGRQIDKALQDCFPGSPPYCGLYESMRYSLTAGGKRLRPALTLECCRMCGGEAEKAMPFACAVEMMHTYSLIHDDLPAMDNDDFRRGKPTSHRMFGEAAAILAGDALQTAAFEMMLRPENCGGIPAERAASAAYALARAAGADGMAGGQSLDIACEGRGLTIADVKLIHRLKTGAMIRAAAEIGCIVGGGGQKELTALCRYAEKIGLAFQIRDDMLDVEGNAATLGKTVGSDRANEKITFVTLLGLEECGNQVDICTAEAKKALEKLEHTEFLCWLADRLAKRDR